MVWRRSDAPWSFFARTARCDSGPRDVSSLVLKQARGPEQNGNRDKTAACLPPKLAIADNVCRAVIIQTAGPR